MLHRIENHIERMRTKPEHVKRQYALGVSLAFVLIVFGFWVTSVTLSLDPEATAAAQAPSPIAALTANANGAFNYIKETFFGANKTEYSSDNIEVTGGKN